jgi:ABC-type multidrug transport system fused ATPase/permease subunit
MKSTTLTPMPLAIRRGKIRRPQKVVIYGPEGVGKSTLAGLTPEPVFLDTSEGSTGRDLWAEA